MQIETAELSGVETTERLRRGWLTAKLEDLAEKITDGTHQPPKFTDSGIPFIIIGNIADNKIVWSSTKKWVSPETFEFEAKRLRPKRDDILYTAVGSYGTAVLVSDDRPFMFQRHIAFIRPDSRVVDPRYLCHALNSPDLKSQADRVARGVAQKTVTLGSLREFRISLPPLAEQKRIVARIDALFAEIEDGEAALADARKGLDTFRRALLKSAVTGELTKDWRERAAQSATARDLLKEIDQIRKRNVSRARSRASIGDHELTTDDLRALPDGWAWATLERLGDIVGGATVDKKRKPEQPVTVPYLRVANVQRGHLDLDEIKKITVERSTAEKLRLKNGDILLNEGGDRDKIGRGWVWDGSIPDMIHQNHVFRLRLFEPGLNPFFISHYANEMGRKFFIEEGKQTTNLASISLSKISKLPVPVPPPAEAIEILHRVSDALSAASDAEAQLDAEAADAARLKQAIFKSAFEGRLVPQDPADEPASALLAPLHSAHTAAPKARGKRSSVARS